MTNTAEPDVCSILLERGAEQFHGLRSLIWVGKRVVSGSPWIKGGPRTSSTAGKGVKRLMFCLLTEEESRSHAVFCRAEPF